MKRHRPKNERYQGKKFHTKYHVPFHHNDGTLNVVPVYQATFLEILQVSRSRIQTVIRNFTNNIESPKEKCGGLQEDRKIAYVAKEEVFIRYVKAIR